MKPFVFLAALISNQELTPLSPIKDERTSFSFGNKKWTPENYGKKYFGEVPLYFALKNSLNSATVALGMEAGLDSIIDVAKKSGITSHLEAFPSLILGSFELYPLEVLQAYSTLSRLGSFIPLRSLRAVVDSNSEVLWKNESAPEQALPAQDVSVLVSMMKQTIVTGTAQSIGRSGFSIPTAGKTGTTSDNKDSWFLGFTPEITTVTWVGYDDNTSHGLTGASGAVPLWLAYMNSMGNELSNADFSWAPGTKKVMQPDTSDSEIELIIRDEINPF